jgi:hypothetical protein
MARIKAKTALGIGIAILTIGVAGIFLEHFALRAGLARRQVLDDGSVLELDRVVVDSRIKFAHGTEIAKLLGNVVPSNGVHLLKFNLNRPTYESFDSGGGSFLVAEFKLTVPRLANNPLLKPAFFRDVRYVLYGENGIEYVQELWRAD